MKKKNVLLLNRLYQRIEQTKRVDPHPGLILASHHFNDPYPLIDEVDLLTLSTMDLLIQFVYPLLSGYAKFTISFTMKRSGGVEISFTLGPGIPLTYEDGSLIPMSDINSHIYSQIKKYQEIYNGSNIIGISIRVYVDGKKIEIIPISLEEKESMLNSLINVGFSEIDPISARDMLHKKRSYTKHITSLKRDRTKLKAFIVADTETILINNIHVPYAAGLLMVRPNESINPNMIDTYFSEDFSIMQKTIAEKSTMVLSNFVRRVETIIKQEKSDLTIYFHNFSRFDGILLLKHLACHHKEFTLKPLLRNNILYELSVYSSYSSGKKLLFRFRDSLSLLPQNLNSLAKNLCPGLGSKGSIPYDKVNESTLLSMKDSLLEYMKQDIHLKRSIGMCTMWT
jgi:hypothetical protein